MKYHTAPDSLRRLIIVSLDGDPQVRCHAAVKVLSVSSGFDLAGLPYGMRAGRPRGITGLGTVQCHVGVGKMRLTPEQEVAYALDYDLARDSLKPEV